MLISLVTNLSSRGLAKDAHLLYDLLHGLGHVVLLQQYDEPSQGQVDLSIFLETVVADLIPSSKAAPWIIPNPEFIYDRDINVIRERFSRVLCKTNEAFRICSELFPEQAVYTEFMAQDRYDATVKRERKFLHVCGSSQVKNTTAVIDAWRWHHNGKGIDAPLVVVSDWFEEENLPPLPWVNDHWEQKVSLVKNISDDELKRLQNECMFHLQPSGTEGFGHTLRESLSVNAILVTTGVPPMNEIESAYFVPSVGSYQFHQATIHEVSPLAIHEAAQGLLSLKERDFPAWDTRKIFLKGNEEFKENFTALLENFNPSAPKIVYSRKREWEGQKRVAFLGNFIPPFSTENDIAWTLEHLGHEVIRLQENAFDEKRFGEAREACDIFLWTHTHQFSNITDLLMEHLLGWFKEHGKPTVSFHLDKFFGIPEREKRIGSDPFFKADFVFTADGGFQDEFAAHGINHIWSPPAIVERDAHYGTPREEYKCDVAFVGSVDGYHDCYPFRTQMIDFLRDRYRQRFKTFTTVRGPALNDLYASCKVCAGDSIFANNGGRGFYCSDRVFETIGRGGVLVHAEILGMNVAGMLVHTPGDLQDMADMIDYLLAKPDSRRSMRESGMYQVRTKETYTQRVRQILKTVFP
jgi:glycosyltransferase involved in cell wall biosynthesis